MGVTWTGTSGSLEQRFHKEIRPQLEALSVRVVTDREIADARLAPDAILYLPNGVTVTLEFTHSISVRSARAYTARAKDSGVIQHVYLVVPDGSDSLHSDENIITLDEILPIVYELSARDRAPSNAQKSLFFWSTAAQFVKEGTAPRSSTLFVAMPFAEVYSDTYFVAIMGAASELGLTAIRMDEIAFSGPILDRMHAEIRKCQLFVADLSDGNPNVMYELGYANALKKPALLISSTAPEQLPFDARGLSMLLYTLGNTNKLRQELKARMEALLAELDEDARRKGRKSG